MYKTASALECLGGLVEDQVPTLSPRSSRSCLPWFCRDTTPVKACAVLHTQADRLADNQLTVARPASWLPGQATSDASRLAGTPRCRSPSRRLPPKTPQKTSPETCFVCLFNVIVVYVLCCCLLILFARPPQRLPLSVRPLASREPPTFPAVQTRQPGGLGRPEPVSPEVRQPSLHGNRTNKPGSRSEFVPHVNLDVLIYSAAE